MRIDRSIPGFHVVVVAVFLAAIAAGQTATKRTTAPPPKAPQKRIPVHVSSAPTKATSQSRVPVRVTTARPKMTAPSVASRSKAAPKAAARPYYGYSQSAPSPDRYREIQSALIAKGYLLGPPTGTWDPLSTAAMKKFQEDQKIEATGKISAKSLIVLGLGPKDESTPSTPK